MTKKIDEILKLLYYMSGRGDREKDISQAKQDILNLILAKLENPYPESIFTPFTDAEWKVLNEVLKKYMGFPIDRVSGNLMRDGFDNCKKVMENIFKEK